MSNWFRKQSESYDIKQDPIRYRVLIPVDIWVESTNDPMADQENVYNLLKRILDNGSQTVNHQGFNSLLQSDDINRYSDVMNDHNLG